MTSVIRYIVTPLDRTYDLTDEVETASSAVCGADSNQLPCSRIKSLEPIHRFGFRNIELHGREFPLRREVFDDI